MTDVECLSCGAAHPMFTELESWSRTTGDSPSSLATAINTYGAVARSTVDVDGVVSWVGLWLVLVLAAEVVGVETLPDLDDILGMPAAQAAAAAEALLADKRPGATAAAGVWLNADAGARFSTTAPPIPTQLEIDAWASDNTDGMIATFPLRVTPDTFALFATALLTKINWQTSMDVDDGRLVMSAGMQAIVKTEAAGLVAVAKPMTADGVDVVSVIAAPEIAQADVWRAVDEVVDLLNRGGIYHRKLEVDSITDQHGYWTIVKDGHSWAITEESIEFPEHTPAREYESVWTTRLPAWDLSTATNLGAAPGIAAISAALLGGRADNAKVVAAQAARAKYDAAGFAAAAVTAIMGFCTGVPQFVTRRVRRVRVDFDHPHAVTAIARGGVWEGIRLFDAWVDPELC